MKVFAIITALLMAAGGSAYYMYQSDDCPLSGSCPVAKSGGCCQSLSSCCEESDAEASEFIGTSEACCAAGIQAAVSSQVSTKPGCCAATDICCVAGAACCVGGENAVAKATDVESCPHCTTPARLVTTAATAGIGLK